MDNLDTCGSNFARLADTIPTSYYPHVRGNVVKVNFSGAVNGKAVWPSKYKPVAWNDDADSIMFKLGIYHIKNKVGNIATNGKYIIVL